MDDIIFESGNDDTFIFESGVITGTGNVEYPQIKMREARTVQQIEPLEYFDSSFLFYGMAASVALVTMGLGMTLIIRLFKKA